MDCASSLKTRPGKKMSLTLGDKEFLKKERHPKDNWRLLYNYNLPHKHWTGYNSNILPLGICNAINSLQGLCAQIAAGDMIFPSLAGFLPVFPLPHWLVIPGTPLLGSLLRLGLISCRSVLDIFF